ncbi:hypothetical protein [uncultured Nocardioides sp.]|uniref:hypothetical protein n=1 Tax=uncultured Nocardioides sp. TaxID=198441 RepID=UPI002620F79B|nr:hypothetical protein [uncultured Nocardioides sp.]
MRTPTDERTGRHGVAWAGALLLQGSATLFAGLDVLARAGASTSAREQLDLAAPLVVGVGLVLTVVLSSLLVRWRAPAPELTAVVPVLVLAPYGVLAPWTALLWTDSGFPLAEEGSWTGGLLVTGLTLAALGVGALLLGWVAGRVPADPVVLCVVLLGPVAIARIVDLTRTSVPAVTDLDFPVRFSLGVVASGHPQRYEGWACSALAVGICERTVGPVGAGVHLLALLAVLVAVAVAASAASRGLRRPRRRLSR